MQRTAQQRIVPSERIVNRRERHPGACRNLGESHQRLFRALSAPGASDEARMGLAHAESATQQPSRRALSAGTVSRTSASGANPNRPPRRSIASKKAVSSPPERPRSGSKRSPSRAGAVRSISTLQL